MCFAKLKTRFNVSRYRKEVNGIVDSLTVKQQKWLGLETKGELYLTPAQEKMVEKRFVIYGFNGKVVAFFDFIRDSSNTKKPNLMACCAVERSHQGRGYGEFIVKTAMNWFYENGSKYGTLYWKVRPDNNISIGLAVRNHLQLLGVENGWAYYCDRDFDGREKRARRYYD